MRLEKISETEDFNTVYSIMEQAFPKCEIRTYEKALALLSNPGYRIYAARGEDGTVRGFISSWKLDGFRFVEHFAVSKDMRGAGTGSRMMRAYLTRARPPVHLEVEAADTANAKRRIAFYQRLGFLLTGFGYFQPNLQKANQKVFLNIMSYPDALTKTEFQRMKEVLFSQVYGVNNI